MKSKPASSHICYTFTCANYFYFIDQIISDETINSENINLDVDWNLQLSQKQLKPIYKMTNI